MICGRTGGAALIRNPESRQNLYGSLETYTQNIHRRMWRCERCEHSAYIDRRILFFFQFYVALFAQPTKYHTRCAAHFYSSFYSSCGSPWKKKEETNAKLYINAHFHIDLIKQTANIESTIKTWANCSHGHWLSIQLWASMLSHN